MIEAVRKTPAPKNGDIEILLTEELHRFDAQGRRESTWHSVFRCLSEKGVDDWSTLETSWWPWREEKPVVRVRVVTPDGQVYWLDPKTIGETHTEQPSQVISDKKALRAPLPAVEVGAVVEQEVVIRETRPLFDRGVLRSFMAGSFAPARKIRLTVDAPVTLPLQYASRGIALSPVRSERDGRVTLVFELEPKKPLEYPEAFLPPDEPRVPRIVFTTGKSWAEVAAGYAALVEPKIDVEAVRQTVRQVVGRETDRRKIIAALVAHLQGLVRYTGVEFGEASIVPYTLREILDRRFGDCKDQSALLVAMLRAAGIPAQLALLHAGTGEDVLPTMPALNAFDHALVLVPGDSPLWIDPIARYVPIGELPLSDQGRLALVASRDTKELVQIPRTDYRKNAVKEVVECRLASGELGQICKTLFYTGSCATELREFYASNNGETIRKSWKKYLQEHYRTRSLKSLDYASARDLDKPFSLSMTADGAKLAYLGSTDVAVRLELSGLFAGLPSFLLRKRPEKVGGAREEAGEEESGSSEEKGRKRPLMLPEPHVRQMIFRIVSPRGFLPQTLPPGAKKQFGPVTVEWSFQLEDKNTVVAAFRLDTGPGRLTAAEVEALRRGLATLDRNQDPQRWHVILSFDHIGAKLLKAGRLEEGLAECRGLVEGEPSCVEHRRRYCDALIHIGLGDAARREARRAIELAPESAGAHKMLGDTLVHDPAGRYFAVGMDWEGAAVAYRKALAIEPSNVQARAAYAYLLVHDHDGKIFAPGARLGEGIAQFQKDWDKAKDLTGVEQAFAGALLYAERVKELEALTREPRSAAGWNAFHLAATAMQQGASAAIQGLTHADSPGDRKAVLLTASDYLQEIRRYPEAKAMLDAVLQNEENASLRLRSSILGKLRRFDPAGLPEDDPCTVVRRWFYEAILGVKPKAELAGLFVPGTTLQDVEVATKAVIDTVHRMRGVKAGYVAPQRTADVVSMLEATATGDKAVGYRIRVVLPECPAQCWYAVFEKGGYRLVVGIPSQAALGRRALVCLAQGNPAAARRWLDWAWEEQKGTIGWFNPLQGTPFARLWLGSKHDDPAVLRAAGAVLAGGDTRSLALIAILEDARQKASADKNDPLAGKLPALDRALALALVGVGQYAETLVLAERILKDYPLAAEPIQLKIVALEGLHRNEELRAFVAGCLKQAGLDAAASSVLIRAAVSQGETELAQTHLRRLAAKKKEASGWGHNALAWNALFLARPDETALGDAQTAIKNSAQRNHLSASLHTLAAVQAEFGKTREALQSLHRSLALRDHGLDSIDRYVLGRIAENCGLNDFAVTQYRLVAPPAQSDRTHTFFLAQRRLEVLARAGFAGRQDASKPAVLMPDKEPK